MRTLAVAVAVLAVASSCSEQKPAPPPAPKKVVDAGAPPPPPPKVQLAAPRPLPTNSALPAVEAPESNPITPEKAELGWLLFFDKRMSKDKTKACSDCHLPEKSWTSGAAKDTRVGGAVNSRNSPTMLNLGYHKAWYWDGRVDSLEGVSLAAWKGQLGANPAEVAMSIGANPTYKAMFDRAFKSRPTEENVPQALATFFRTLNSTPSAFDKFQAGDKKALSADAQKGFALFKSRGCVNCHIVGPFSDFDFHKVEPFKEGGDPGRAEATKATAEPDAGVSEDLGKFKTPTLRGVAESAPYWHDGSIATLDEAIEKMAVGDPKVKPKELDPKLKLAKLAPKEKAQLKAFLESLSSPGTWAAPEKLPE